MKLDLERLKEIHPRLPRSTAAEYAYRAALALQRRHAPGVELALREVAASACATLHWTERASVGVDQLDRHRVTEDAAEAVALVLVHASRGWVVSRRLQRGEHGDWLLHDPRAGSLVALEVSGTDDGDAETRMTEKMAQVERSSAAEIRAACVVRFREPCAALELLPEVSR